MYQAAERLGVSQHLPEMLEITREVFGDEFAIRVLDDPEIEDFTHIVVETTVRGTAEQLLKQERAWFDTLFLHIGKSSRAFIPY